MSGDVRAVEQGYIHLPALSAETDDKEAAGSQDVIAGTDDSDPPSTTTVINSALVEEDIYGAALVSLVNDLDPDTGILSGSPLSIVRLSWTMTLLTVNLLIQFFILICIDDFIIAPATHSARRIYLSFHEHAFVDGVFDTDLWQSFDGKDELCQLSFAQPTFITVILFIWVITVTRELRTLGKQIRTNLHLPTVTSVRECHELGDDREFVIIGLTERLRVTIFVMVYIPRLFIGIFLSYMGCRWLSATTSFSDLVLNCVALVFVIELDELFYEALIPFAQKEQVASTQVKIRHSNHAGDSQHLVGHHLQKYKGSMHDLVPYGRCLLWAVGSVTLVLLYIHEFQMVLPHYRHDVHSACIDWYKRSSKLATMHMLFGRMAD